MATSILGGAALMSLAASAAQAAEAAAAPVSEVSEIVVTGTRIKGVTNSDSPSPVSVTTAVEIQMTKASSIEDILTRMTGPDFANGGLSSASNNGGAGLSEVGLRGLGPSRTLVLIDGQRLIPIFSGASSVVDLNAVPVSMVERIEVLRDGASSIYGADAIGGVINIITKRHADGMTMDAGYGTSGHGDGNTANLSASVGINGDKSNVMIAVSWDHRDEIEQSARGWAVDPHLNAPFGEGGSAYRSQLDILQDENSSNVWANGTLYDLHNPAVAGLAPNLVYLPKTGRVKMNAGGPGWNWLTGAMDRKQISFTSHYDILPQLTFIADGFYTSRVSDQSLRPEPLLGDTIATTVFAGFVVPSYAPGNTTGQDITAFLTPTQFGPRRYHQQSDTVRFRTGFEGKLFDKFDFEAGYVYETNTTRSETRNEGNFNHLAQITGQITCVDVPGGCTNGLPTSMPNFFNGPNMFTAAQVKYLTFTNTDHNDSSENYIYANISGALFELPYGTLRGALGVETRREHLSDSPDQLVQEGWGPNQSGPTTGGYSVNSVYAELNIPVVKDLPFLKSVVLTPSGRYDDYSTFGSAKTGKIGLDWELTEDVRIRSTYSTGFRAPSVAELFGGQVISDLTASGDPCDTRAAGINGNANVGKGVLSAGSNCAVALAGVPGAETGGVVTNYQSPQNNVTQNQEQVLIGGNPHLNPELSRGVGVGLVLTPHQLPGLSFEADYYRTKIRNAVLIGGIASVTSPDVVLLGCYGSQQLKSFCPLIHRNAAGTITQIDSLNSNFGTNVVEGIDFQVSYDTAAAHLDLPFPGSIAVDLQAGLLIKNDQDQADGSVAHLIGKFVYANEGINPKWKGVFSADYKLNEWTFHWDTRFVGHTESVDGGPSVSGNRIPEYYYNDLSLAYAFNDMLGMKTGRVIFGVDNLFDKEPPFLSGDSICKCNSLAGPYDFVGRFFFGRLSTSF